MIVRKGQSEIQSATAEQAARLGPYTSERYSECGGLTQFGAYVETLPPGSWSSDKHWHELEDEFLLVLSGELTVIEDDTTHVLTPGDAACWPAGSGVAHHAVNRSAAPCSFLIMGSRVPRDVVHYPDRRETIYVDGRHWKIVGHDGVVRKEGSE